jgi:hypothetical protein
MGERKVKVEIRIGRDEDGDWWTVLMVDGNEALWRGPYEPGGPKDAPLSGQPDTPGWRE